MSEPGVESTGEAALVSGNEPEPNETVTAPLAGLVALGKILDAANAAVDAWRKARAFAAQNNLGCRLCGTPYRDRNIRVCVGEAQHEYDETDMAAVRAAALAAQPAEGDVSMDVTHVYLAVQQTPTP